MKRFLCSLSANLRSWALLCLALAATGCERTEPPLFRLNFEGVDPAAPPTPEINQQLVDVLDGFFGQPNKPYVVEESGLDFAKVALSSGPTYVNGLVVLQKYKGENDAKPIVRVVAGPQIRDDAESLVIADHDLGETFVKKSEIIGTHKQAGLYRQHCAHCHGTTGDGDGPTATLLNPYPRDFRKGMFKFVSGKTGAQPTREDLHHTLSEGIVGTGMPSFRLLSQADRDSLVEYVMYLSMRGQNETFFRDALVEDPKVFEPDPADPEYDPYAYLIDEGVFDVSGWERAEKNGGIVPVARPNMPLEESIAKGRELYLDKRLNCIGCHGITGLGDGLGKANYDVWNEGKVEHPTWYSLPIQDLPPRNLRSGVYRGGRRPVDLYRRIYSGINPSKMPAFSTVFAGKEEQIWHLVDYVRAMPFELNDEAGAVAQAAVAAQAAAQAAATGETTAPAAANAPATPVPPADDANPDE
ncbi:MAG TPA: c-type cytochrome [Pirellulales bacterium]